MVASSLFTSDGKISLKSKKAYLMHAIEKEMKQANALQANEERLK